MKLPETGGLRFGEGRPKICIPLTGQDQNALEQELQAAKNLPGDLYEWRVDCFQGSPLPLLPWLREAAGKPLLCTIRTEREGGEAPLDPSAYQNAVEQLIEAGGFSLVDIELACGRERVSQLVKMAHGKGILAIVSKHDFCGTPDQARMLSFLTEMKALGADLPKLAVTPCRAEDVLVLLSVTLEAYRRLGPVITMSMGPLGGFSRVCGELTGSCLTFGAGASASAPGQIPAKSLEKLLDLLHMEEEGRTS